MHTHSKQALPPTQCHTSALSLKASRPMVLGETEARVNLLPVEAQLFVFCSLPPPVDSSKQKVVVLAYLTFWPGLDPPASTHLPPPPFPTEKLLASSTPFGCQVSGFLERPLCFPLPVSEAGPKEVRFRPTLVKAWANAGLADRPFLIPEG